MSTSRSEAWRPLLLGSVLIAAACGQPARPPPESPFQQPPSKPISSDLGAAQNGGGCTPAPLNVTLADQYDLVNPSWVPVVNGSQPDSLPALMHGTVLDAHGDTGGDFPNNHLSADVNADIALPASEKGFASTSNDIPGAMHIEWESGSLPAFAWYSAGDYVTVLGRWIFDCGHPDPDPGKCALKTSQKCVTDADCQPPVCADCSLEDHCEGEHFHYGSEMHPPYAVAVSRLGRGAVVTDKAGAAATAATRTDVFVSPDGGAAGDRCVVTHVADDGDFLFNHECFPLSHPLVAKYFNKWDFPFDIPLPPRPLGATMSWRIVPRDTPGGRAAALSFTPHPDGASPTLHVEVELSARTNGQLPTGYAGTIYAGWNAPPPQPLTHVRVTVEGVTIHNPLRPATPVVRAVKDWVLEASVNGEAQRLTGLAAVDAGEDITENLVYDQYLPPGGKVHFYVEGTVHSCIDTLFAQSFSTDISQLGLGGMGDCLVTTDPLPGKIDVTYAAPDFGTGGDARTYDTVGAGGDGGACSVTTTTVCLSKADCPSGETCDHTGGAYTIHYRIEKVP